MTKISSIDSETFHALSGFYVSLWDYVNTFFDDARWLQTAPTLIDPYVKLEKSLERVQHDEIDGVTYKQVLRDFNKVEELREALQAQNNKPDDTWFKQAERIRSYSQELGLRYAEMATEH